MPITWNSEAEARLLLGILDQLKGTRLDYKALADYMGCSTAAIKQHICKLRREVASGSPTKSNSTLPSPANTPRKSKRASYPQTPVKKAKSAYSIPDDDDEDDDDDAEETKVIVKKEDGADEKKKMANPFVVELED